MCIRDSVGFDAEVFDRPQLAGTEKSHLDLVDDEQNSVFVQYALEAGEEVRRWNDVAAGALDRLDIERRIFALAYLRIPHAVVFGFEQALEFCHAIFAVLLLGHALRAAEVIREFDELGAVEMSVAAPVAVRRGDRRGTERAAVIAALEREHQALAAACVAHEL